MPSISSSLLSSLGLSDFNQKTFPQDKQKHYLDAKTKAALAQARLVVVHTLQNAVGMGKREIEFAMPSTLNYATQLILLRELLDRFPSKQFYWWCVITYGDYADWKKLARNDIEHKSAMGITERYKIVL